MSVQHLIFVASIFFAASITQLCPTVATTTSSSSSDKVENYGLFSVFKDKIWITDGTSQAPFDYGWRIFFDGWSDVPTGIIDVHELVFYETTDCTGTKIASSNNFIESGNAGPGFQPGNAFDGNTGINGGVWGGRRTGDKWWLGMMFEEDYDVLCVKLFQWGGHYGRGLTVQRMVDGIWTDMRDAKNLVKGENTISLVVSPTLSPTASPTNAATDSPTKSGCGLLDAIVAITGHVDGSKSLTRGELAVAAGEFSAKGFLLGTAEKFYTAALDLVDAYELYHGPLFINASTKNGFARENSNDDLYLERIIVDVQQTVLDRVYSGTTSDTTAGSQAPFDLPDVPSGRYWQTASYFPGYVDPPDDPAVEHRIQIVAKNAAIWPPNRRSCFDRDPLIRATGLYLVPGGIATIRVSNEIANFDGTSLFEVRVGSNDSNLKYHNFYRRMDRVTSSFPIVTSETTVASPLGGGIYIRVPYLADEGTIEIRISGAVVQAPIFSKSNLRTTTRNEWENTLRNAPGPMADFETDKFLMQVPSSWMAKHGFDHLTNLAISRDAAMDGINYFIGMESSERNDYVWYLQPDFQIRSAGGYGVGYPQVNRNFRSGPDGIVDTHDPSGEKLYLEDPHYLWDVGYHELGHCTIPSFYRGEGEALVNLIYAYVSNVVAGVDFDTAFMKSFNSQARFTPDRTAVDWMIRANFREGNEMSYSNDENDEFRYQQKGYARYADIARLFGWEVLHNFWRQEHLDDAEGVESPGWELDKVDSRTLRLSIAAGFDLRPLIRESFSILGSASPVV